MHRFSLLAALSLCFAFATIGQAQQIKGDYIESRSADVYVAACFANSEIGLVGNQAILGWRITEGAFNGVRLDGLSVVAVARANATLGDPFANPYPAKAVLIVDQKATAAQQDALISLAQKMAGQLLDNIVRVETAPIQFELESQHGHPSRGLVRAGELARVETRPIGHGDHLCGNEITFYPPLIKMTHAMPAVALLDQFRGYGLDASWQVRDKRSAFVGNFVL